jgi:hypothetical protein
MNLSQEQMLFKNSMMDNHLQEFKRGSFTQLTFQLHGLCTMVEKNTMPDSL